MEFKEIYDALAEYAREGKPLINGGVSIRLHRTLNGNPLTLESWLGGRPQMVTTRPELAFRFTERADAEWLIVRFADEFQDAEIVEW